MAIIFKTEFLKTALSWQPKSEIDTLLAPLKNMFRALPPDIIKRLKRVVASPSEKTWNDAYSIILMNSPYIQGGSLTLWKAVLAVDPDFPSTGPSEDNKGKIVERWRKIPDRETLINALGYADNFFIKAKASPKPKKGLFVVKRGDGVVLTDPMSHEECERWVRETPRSEMHGPIYLNISIEPYVPGEEKWQPKLDDEDNKLLNSMGIRAAGEEPTTGPNTYKVGIIEGWWYIIGLPGEPASPFHIQGQQPNSFLDIDQEARGMDLAEQLYVELYDEFQLNENLKSGDIFDTPVGQFACSGEDVVPHDAKARAAIAAVDESYRCTCGCDQGKHRKKYDNEGVAYYGECSEHPECQQYHRKV